VKLGWLGYIEYYNETKYFDIHPHYRCKIKVTPILILFLFNFFIIRG
jgi:hypothetical protein